MDGRITKAAGSERGLAELGSPAALDGGGNPCRSTTLVGFMPFAVFVLVAGQANVSIRPRPPAVDLIVHPGSANFLPGDRRFSASGRSLAQPPARRICAAAADHGRSGSAPGFSPAAKPRPKDLLPWRRCTALGFASCRSAATDWCAHLISNMRHAVSAGSSASGSLRSWAWAAIRSLMRGTTWCRRIRIVDAAGPAASCGADAWPIPPVSSRWRDQLPVGGLAPSENAV